MCAAILDAHIKPMTEPLLTDLSAELLYLILGIACTSPYLMSCVRAGMIGQTRSNQADQAQETETNPVA